MKLRCGRRPVSLILLAGGKGRRMRADKALLPVPGGTLAGTILAQVENLFDEVLVSVSRGQAGAFPGRRTVVDEMEGRGPMAGVLAGLKASRNEVCVALACDIPEVDLRLLRSLLGSAVGREIAVPVTAEGLLEPLFAVYTKGLIPRIESFLGAGEFSLLPLIAGARTAKVPMGRMVRLRNLNTPEDYDEYLRSLAGGSATGRLSGKGRRTGTVQAPRTPAPRIKPRRRTRVRKAR